MIRKSLVLIPLLAAISHAQAQQPAADRPTFSVASVKPNRERGSMGGAPQRSGDRITWTNAPLQFVVLYAYNIPALQFSGTVPFDFYNFDAIAEASTTDDQLRLMFRSLLEDRFGIKVHRETKETDVFNLLVAKGGSKLKPAVEDSVVAISGRPLPSGYAGTLVVADGAHIIAKGVPLARLVNQLGGALHRPVIDQTGIAGTFDYDVKFRLDEDLDNANGNPFIGKAIEDALGLRVESGKAPVEMLVLDRIEKPSEN